MNLGVVGYLVTLSNLQAFGGPNSHVKDLSVKVADVASLANELKGYSQCPLDNYRDNGYCRVGNVGRYLSKNLRKYLFENVVGGGEESLILTILFKDSVDSKNSSEEDNFSHILIRKDGLKEDEMHDFIDKYLYNQHQRTIGRT